MKRMVNRTLDFVGMKIFLAEYLQTHILQHTWHQKKYSEKITDLISSNSINTFQSFVLYIVVFCSTLWYSVGPSFSGASARST